MIGQTNKHLDRQTHIDYNYIYERGSTHKYEFQRLNLQDTFTGKSRSKIINLIRQRSKGYLVNGTFHAMKEGSLEKTSTVPLTKICLTR